MTPSPSRPQVLAMAGSTREGSFNKRLLRIAVAGARAAGGDVTELDLRDVPLPLYDGDLEAREGIPPNGLRVKQLLLENHGLLIASPEYNSSFSGVLKNTLDWASRPAPGESPLACFVGKVAVLMSASPGALGGLRGLGHVRAMLSNIHVLVLPDQLAISKAHEAFTSDGRLNDARRHEAVEQLGRTLVEILIKLQAPTT